MSFISYTIRWVGSNMAIPFWIVGHIHLSTNVYQDIYEILASFGMNIIVGLAFWLEWREHKKNKSIDNK
jgi:hypothetical protein